jgi:hypothetical protein
LYLVGGVFVLFEHACMYVYMREVVFVLFECTKDPVRVHHTA